MMDDDGVMIRCTLCAEVDPPPAPSDRAECEMCHRSVWLSHLTVELVERHHPGQQIHVTCMNCVPEGEHEVMHLPAQVQDLRRHGIPDPMIAATLAAAEVAIDRTLEEVANEIITDPYGVRATAYRMALERTTAFVASVERET